jgi:peptide/nickel transport system substrate-binding protein
MILGTVSRLAACAALLGSAALCAQGTAEQPQYGGTAVAALGSDPAALNPDITVGAPDVFAGCILYDGLVRFAEGFRIVPSLAKSWTISPDALTYTFQLNKANWTDGKPLTSEDVKFTLLEVSSKFGSKFVAPGQAIREILTPNPQTVVIKLSKPFGPFLFSLACEQNAAILPAHIFRGTDVLKNPATLTKPVGSGPFMLQEWVRGSQLTFVKNPDYRAKGEPFLDRIVVKIMPDPGARILALQAGEVDYIDQYYFPISAFKVFERNPKFSLKEVNYPSDDIIILNTRKPPLDNAKVRQALMIALDRNYIQKNVFLGSGQAGASPFDTRIRWAYNPAVNYEKMYPHDKARADALLDEAGFKRGADGNRFTIRLSFDPGRGEYTSFAQAIQRYWQAVGIKVALEGAERPVVLKKVYADYDFDATLQNYSTSGDPALGIARTFHSAYIKQGTSFNNASGYSNPQVDELFDKGRDAPDQTGRAKYYFQAQEILARDLPTLTVHQQAQMGAASENLRGMWQAAAYQWWNRAWLKK